MVLTLHSSSRAKRGGATTAGRASAVKLAKWRTVWADEVPRKSGRSTLVLALALVFMLLGCSEEARKTGQSDSASGPDAEQQASPTKVDFVEVESVSVPRTRELPGRVVPYQVAEIRPQVGGIIRSRLFEQGSYVEKGEQLFQIDAERYQAEHQTAKANLQDAQAELQNARTLKARYDKLVGDDLIDEQSYDDARARVAQARAAVKQAEAAVDLAKLNLEYTRVLAPIGGYIGPSSVTKGGLVTARQTNALAVVRQLDPVYVDVTQPAADALPLQQWQRIAKDTGESQSDLQIRLYAGDSEELYAHTGRLSATDPVADTATGEIRLRLEFPNPDTRLVPGMFVRAAIDTVDGRPQIIVPQQAVNIGEGGDKSVWTINADGRANRQPIRTGAAYGNHWVVLDGLDVGDRVIVKGTMALREGAPIEPTRIDVDLDPPQGR